MCRIPVFSDFSQNPRPQGRLSSLVFISTVPPRLLFLVLEPVFYKPRSHHVISMRWTLKPPAKNHPGKTCKTLRDVTSNFISQCLRPLAWYLLFQHTKPLPMAGSLYLLYLTTYLAIEPWAIIYPSNASFFSSINWGPLPQGIVEKVKWNDASEVLGIEPGA